MWVLSVPRLRNSSHLPRGGALRRAGLLPAESQLEESQWVWGAVGVGRDGGSYTSD